MTLILGLSAACCEEEGEREEGERGELEFIFSWAKVKKEEEGEGGEWKGGEKEISIFKSHF